MLSIASGAWHVCLCSRTRCGAHLGMVIRLYPLLQHWTRFTSPHCIRGAGGPRFIINIDVGFITKRLSSQDRRDLHVPGSRSAVADRTGSISTPLGSNKSIATNFYNANGTTLLTDSSRQNYVELIIPRVYTVSERLHGQHLRVQRASCFQATLTVST